MLAWSFHMFIIIYLYRRYCLRFDYWDSTATYLLFSLYQFLIVFYWTGDYNKSLYTLPKYYKFYIIFVIIFVLHFYMHGAIFHRYLYGRNLMVSTGVWCLNILQNYFQTFFVNQVKSDFKDYLDEEWYNYQLNYKKYYKSKFILFMRFISIILVILHIYIFFKILYLIYYLPHKWLITYVLTFEKKKIFFLIKILKYLFLYNLITSIVFNKLTGSWFFLFYSYQTNEDYIYPLTQKFDIWEIMGIYGGHHHFDYVEEVAFIKFTLSGNFGRRHLNRKEIRTLFTKESLENFRYRLPKKWNSYKMSELDSLITHNYYFKYWLWLQGFYHFTIGLYKEAHTLIIIFNSKNIFTRRTWLYYNLKCSGNNTYKQNKFSELAKIKLKKYEFK